MVRTVAGPIPIDVLWRRLDANFADPLELDPQSKLGTPGLVAAVRRGSVTLVNALGSGVLEIRALQAFLPRFCERLLGQPLALPNIATWWCGQPAEAAHVIANADRMLVGEALSTSLPFDPAPNDPPRLDPQRLRDAVSANGANFVGQEVVTLSTTPALVEGELRPRPMSLRVFLARTRDGWEVMPGGYARIGRSNDSTALAMRRGGSGRRCLDRQPEARPQDTMLASSKDGFQRAVPGRCRAGPPTTYSGSGATWSGPRAI